MPPSLYGPPGRSRIFRKQPERPRRSLAWRLRHLRDSGAWRYHPATLIVVGLGTLLGTWCVLDWVTGNHYIL